VRRVVVVAAHPDDETLGALPRPVVDEAVVMPSEDDEVLR
jgi:hypothetical protein